ncbi:MAG: hypothetical protein LRZ98_01615 [Candidatus Pacebacteria bacterium]|nr:hypothetical protein [Candidatus Paceibacterota bacterium]
MFDFLSKKKNRYICGINFEKQLNFQLLEIKRINNSFTPTFFRNIKIDGVYEKNIFNRIKFINFFKQYFPYLHSKNINVYLTDSYPKLKKEIEESLKIIGFRKVIFIENKNTLGIIVPNFSASPVSVFYFTKIKVYFIFIKNNKIIYLDEFKIQNFSIKIVENHIEKTKNDNIFITGHFIDNRIDIISKILNKMGLRFKLLNI